MAEVNELWKSGLLVEGRTRGAEPVGPEDRLRVVPGLPIQERLLFTENGVATVELNVGATQLTFDEPELLGFGRALYARRLGFIAGEAQPWAGRSMEQTMELLDSLLNLGVLERV